MGRGHRTGQDRRDADPVRDQLQPQGLGEPKQVKVAGLPATVLPNGQVMVSFEDGTMLNFESSDFTTADAALSGMGDLVDEFPVAEISQALTPH
jgi:hypothetical protein